MGVWVRIGGDFDLQVYLILAMVSSRDDITEPRLT